MYDISTKIAEWLLRIVVIRPAIMVVPVLELREWKSGAGSWWLHIYYHSDLLKSVHELERQCMQGVA